MLNIPAESTIKLTKNIAKLIEAPIRQESISLNMLINASSEAPETIPLANTIA
jgi:hypothetical protein